MTKVVRADLRHSLFARCIRPASLHPPRTGPVIARGRAGPTRLARSPVTRPTRSTKGTVAHQHTVGGWPLWSPWRSCERSPCRAPNPTVHRQPAGFCFPVAPQPDPLCPVSRLMSAREDPAGSPARLDGCGSVASDGKRVFGADPAGRVPRSFGEPMIWMWSGALDDTPRAGTKRPGTRSG